MGDVAVPDSPGEEHAAVTRSPMPFPAVPVPAMPVIRPSEWFEGPPYPALRELNPTIGWQVRPRAEGGPGYVIITRSALGRVKVLERFPLTQEGWAAAWQVLARLNPAEIDKATTRLAARGPGDQEWQRQYGVSSEVAGLDARTLACLREVVLLGGYTQVPQAALAAGGQYDVRFLEDRLIVVPCRQADILAAVPYTEVETVEIGGPGLVKTGGGFIGGGFGAAGAIEGMAVAAILNSLTTRTSVKTVARVQETGCELFLLHTRTTPEQLRIYLSRPLGTIRSARAAKAPTPGRPQPDGAAAPAVQELARLAQMLENGLLTREEFDLLKAKLIAGS